MTNTFYTALAQTLARGETVTMASGLEGEASGIALLGQHAFWTSEQLYAENEALEGFWRETAKAGSAAQREKVLLECLHAREQLIICGGGHVAHPLAKIGAMLDFDVTVLDDRAEFANAERYPEAKEIICAPYDDAMRAVPYGDNCYFVIVTPGHAADRQCLEWVLDVNRFGYLGMIGSRKKTELVMAELTRQGRAPELLKRIHAPIGLRIGAQTPAEIALCIAAELVQVRAGLERGSEPAQTLPAGGFDSEGLEALARGERMMLATVIEKHGSAPRGVGARLMVDQHGKLYGTTGGGAGEAGVIAAAPKVLQDGKPCRMHFAMNNDDARKAGMICGGEIDVLLERVN